MRRSVIVVGGGASGIVAAIEAARAGASVTILEKQKSLARKVAASGNGQCNISNSRLSHEYYHGANPLFTRNIFGHFSLDDTRAFFLSIGLPLCERQQGRLYPFALQARTVCEFLEDELRRLHVSVQLHRCVESITPLSGGAFKLVTAGRDEYFSDSVILATGGRSFSKLGGSSRGYQLSEMLGHTVSETYPSIIPLSIPEKAIHRLEGIKWDSRLTVQSGNKLIAQSSGELLFTNYGISGPVTLDISGAVNRLVVSGRPADVVIDLFSGFSHDELNSFLLPLYRGASVSRMLEAVVKKRMPEYILYKAGIEPERRADSLSSEERSLLVEHMKALCIEPGSPRSFEEAMVTAGGIDVGQLVPATCESKLVPGLYITGELLDIDGDCGGFNLQFAWSSGAVAGRASAIPSS
ncbi:MAG: NAD(P)/FAD-dependent oxidoreductase [Spirochaetes bacterium]|nr:NAD(P)/FAD-dependent oxidoreductase [Spirochaetota bacterium]